MNLPWSKFYWRDWQGDIRLRGCSLAARGLWVEMLAIMAQSDRYGYLSSNGKAIDVAQLARLIGDDGGTVKGLVDELVDAGVPSLDGDVIYSRRMVREMQAHELAVASGKRGGNPSLRKRQEDTRYQIPDSREAHNPPHNPPLKGHDAPEWTMADFQKAAHGVGMKPADVEACFHNYAACGFIDAAGRKITSIPSLLAKWKANQPSHDKPYPRSSGGLFRGTTPDDGPSEEWTRAYREIADMIWRAKEGGEGVEAIRRAMQKARDAYGDVPKHSGRHVVDAAIEMAMNNRRPPKS